MKSHMMRFRSFGLARLCFALSASVLLAVLATVSPDVAAAEVWIVTDSTHPIQPVPHARMIELDAPARVEAMLSQTLPADPMRAAAIARQRLRANHGALTRRLAAAWQAVTDAWQAGVTTIPAVMVDRRYVVYGDDDAAHAVARIQAWREAHP